MRKSDRVHGRGGGDPSTPRNMDGTGPLPYDVVKPLAVKAVKDSDGMDAMTYDPKSNRIYDIRLISQALALFGAIMMGDSSANPNLPIYLIAITCHTSVKMDHIMKKAYIYASQRVNQPLIGMWTDEAEVKYLDIVIPVQFQEAFKSDEMAMELGRKHEQDYIIRLEPDGTYDILKTH